MRGERRIVALVLAALVVVAALVLAAPASATFPGRNGFVVFQSARDGDFDLWAQNLDGSSLRKLLVREGTDEFNASWNRSGTRLVFQSGPTSGSDFDLYLVDADGTDLTPLVVGPTFDWLPEFCDNDTVVFQRTVGGAGDIYAIETDGTGLRRLTDDPANDSTPACSPEGTKVAFTSTRNGVFGIYEVPLASAQAARAPLLATPTLLVSNALDADYSPDGQSLAYAGFNPATGIVDVFTRNLSTGAVTRLSSSSTPSVQNRLPTFFPADPGGVLWTTVTAVPARSLLTFEDDVTSNRPCDVIGRAARAQLGVIEFCLKAIEQAGAAVVQPIPVCACTELSVAVPNRGIGVGEAQSGGKRVTRFFVTVNWTLVCSGGIGVDCSGKLRLVSPGGGLSVSETRRLTKKGKKTISTKIKQPVDCSRRCNPAAQSKATGTVRVTLQSTKALSALAGKEFPVLKVIAECAGKQTTQEISVELSGSGRVKTIIWTSPE